MTNLKQTPEKSKFLELLKTGAQITDALKESGLSAKELFLSANKKTSFKKEFDDIINFQLEILFLETVFKSKSPTLITFALASRLGGKYNKKTPAEERKQPLPLVFVEDDPHVKE